MELVNLCPLRVAGALRPSTSGLQFSVIACGTLVRRPDGALDLAATQRAPDVNDLQWLEPRGPQSRSSSDRKVSGRVVAGGAFFAFDGVPRDRQKQRVVEMRPKLFVQEAHGAREVALDLVSVAYDGEAHEVTVVWRGHSPVDAETADGRAVVALERGGEKTVWAELGASVEGLLSSPMCERFFIEAEPTLSDIGEATVSLGPGEARERFGESPLPFAPPSQRSPDWVDPEHLATMRLSAPPNVVERRSIGQILAERPSFATPERRPLDAEPDQRASGAVSPRSATEAGFALDLLWHAEGASARLRKQPALKRLILAARSPNDEVRETYDIASVAKSAPPTRLDAIGESMDAAIHEGVLEAPALVIDGTISLAFEPVELLRALVGATRALVKLTERLSKALTSAESVTKGELEDAAWALAEPETTRLREAIAAAARPEVAKAVEEAVDRKLTRDKKIVAVTVLGAPHFVAHISTEGDSRSLAAVYLPRVAADRWPLVRRFPVRLIAEAHTPFDDREPGVAALVGLAMYRRIAPRSG